MEENENKEFIVKPEEYDSKMVKSITKNKYMTYREAFLPKKTENSR